MSNKFPFCECGCKQRVSKLGNRFIRGHSWRGKYHSEETLEKMRIAQKEVRNRLEVRETKACECGCGETFVCKVNGKQRFLQGHNTLGSNHWNWVPSERRICAHPDCNIVYICKVISARKYCSVTCANRANAVRGQSDEHRMKNSLAVKKKWRDPEYREKQRRERRERWQDEEYKERVLKNMARSLDSKPNIPETTLNNLLQESFLGEYKYVGDGEVWFGGKNPDFININGQKKIIEMFGDYWHGEERIGILSSLHEQERKDVFRKYGYETLIIWEHELEDVKRLVVRIRNFSRD